MNKTILFITHSANYPGGAEDDFERIIAYFSRKPDYIIHVLSPKGKRFEIYSKYSDKIGLYKEGWFPIMTASLKLYLKYILIGIIQINDIRKFIRNNSYDIAILNVSVLYFPTIIMYFSKIRNNNVY